MTLPAKVQESLDEANRLEAEEMARLAKQEQEQSVETPVADPPPVETKPNDTPAPTPTETPQPSQQDDQVAKITAELERLRLENEQLNQRYRTAQGMLSKRDGDQADAMRVMQAKLDAIERRTQEPVKPKENPAYKYLSPEEKQALEEAGDTPLEIRAAKGEADTLREELAAQREADRKALLEEFDRKAQEREAQIFAEQQAQVTQTQLFSKVETLVPGFTAEDSTPGSNWRKFLEQTDPATGRTYRDRAVGMVQIGYADGIASLFKEYKAMLPGGNKAQELEKLVKPTTSTASQAPTKGNEDVITLQMVNAFYQDKANGNLRKSDGSRMTNAEAAAIEAKLDDWFTKEQLAGRIRQG